MVGEVKRPYLVVVPYGHMWIAKSTQVLTIQGSQSKRCQRK